MVINEDTIKISKLDDVYLKIECDSSISYQLRDNFTFKAPNYRFHPLYKSRVWDGNLRFFNPFHKKIYFGLRKDVEKFAETHQYKVEYGSDFSDNSFSLQEAKEYIESLNIPEKFERRDYQVEAFAHAIRKSRALFLSPTASGKSFIIYLITRYFQKKTLIIVPTIQLVHQMAGDFIDYGYEKNIHKITGGVSKDTDCDIVVSTWQSLTKMNKEWFSQFGVVIGDEAHLCAAKSLKTIFEKLTHCPIKFGFTGTLDGTIVNQMTLEGLFGPIKRVAYTTDLIDQNYLSELSIKFLMLEHKDEHKKLMKGKKYQEEKDFLCGYDRRNRFIVNLALSLKGNTLLMFTYIDKHGSLLKKLLEEKGKGRKIFYVDGSTDGEFRDEIRKIVEIETNAIILSSSVFSTGTNIKNIHNIIFSSPTKSKIKTLQSIGRGLRTSATKSKVTLYDIADDLSYKKHENYVLKHSKERLNIYAEEGFNVKIYHIKL